jgi:polar amino acid transport system substrate-binding protein
MQVNKLINSFVGKLLACFVFVLLVLGAIGLTSCVQQSNPNTRISVYDRVLKSGTIRTSYANYPPYCIVDANSGKLSGIFVDILQEAGKRLGLKVNWVEPVGWGEIFEGLNSDRYDIFGAGIWPNSSRAKVGDFTRPLFYNAILVYGRSDESRIKSLDDINKPDMKIATMDGAIEDIIASSDFPNAKKVSVPQLNPWSDVLLNITSGKADVTFAGPSAVNLYLAKNPGTLKVLFPGKPMRVFANCFAIKVGEPEFKAMLNTCLDEMLNDGTISKILQKYEASPGEIWPVAEPYVVPQPNDSIGTGK